MRILVVLLLFVAVGVGGYYWYLQDSEQAAETAEASVLPPTDVFVPPPAAGGFNMDQAFNLAGSHVPQRVNSFYLQNVDPEVSLDENITALQELMNSAIKDKDYIAVIGADTMLTFDVLNAVLDRLGEQTLANVIVIYLGRPEHESPLQRRVEDAGGEFRFSAYPLEQA